MKITANARYGLRILVDLAQRGEKGAVRTVGEIAASQAISEKFVSRLVAPLKKAGLVVASRGAAGGLALARPARRITVLEVVEAIQGPVALVHCLAKPKSCPRIAHCGANRMWAKANEALRKSLASMNVASVMGQGLSGQGAHGA